MIRLWGHYLWKAWGYFYIFLLLPLGIVAWWIDPWFGYWGYIVAAALTVIMFLIYRDMWRKWRADGLRNIL